MPPLSGDSGRGFEEGMKDGQRQLVGFGWGLVFGPCKSWRWLETHILLGLSVPPTHPGSGMRVGGLLTYAATTILRSSKGQEKREKSWLTNRRLERRHPSNIQNRTLPGRVQSYLFFSRRRQFAPAGNCSQLHSTTVSKTRHRFYLHTHTLLKVDRRFRIDCV